MESRNQLILLSIELERANIVTRNVGDAAPGCAAMCCRRTCQFWDAARSELVRRGGRSQKTCHNGTEAPR